SGILLPTLASDEERAEGGEGNEDDSDLRGHDEEVCFPDLVDPAIELHASDASYCKHHHDDCQTEGEAEDGFSGPFDFECPQKFDGHVQDCILVLASSAAYEMREAFTENIADEQARNILTALDAVEIGTGKIRHSSPITQRGNIKSQREPPVYHQRTNTIHQLPKQTEEAEFDGDDGTPCQYQHDGDPLVVIVGILEEAVGYVEPELARHYGLDQEHLVDGHSVDDDECAYQAADCYDQEGIVER
ncbi:MAG: hypothetical protein Q9222_007282, partial [Ikaeria aurantiellina]